MASHSATAASEHITLPFDLRTHPRALYKPENTKLLENLFPGTYELSTDGMFIYFLQTEMPPKPWPKSVAGLTPYFALRMSRQYTPCLIGFQVPMRNRAIAESVVEGRDMADWELLFIIIRNYFRQVEISITEVMYWSNSVVVILQHRDINIRKLPWKVSNIGVFYRYEDEMDRPSTPQSRCETDTRLENQVLLQRLTPAKGRRTGEFLFLVASDTDLIEGSFKVTSFQRVEEQWVFTIWLYMGQDSSDTVSPVYGTAIWTSDGDVLGFVRYAPTVGLMKDWCAGIAADEFIDREGLLHNY
ncbi:hypothetical protein VE01_03884 [Pseudogymnoascus verrucosus]|uniref:Uncharacterized protein n=1 Tax=Pseudogymnoascus verrucosus TaxID=342668 RepID=A0A1B8GQ89_9PEZI|nr:uncharacterized protein VE01_03884 [Pseudogymnoascus verrucosus]OBT97970.1 hypothetical protein VE01_03884 [Pseudogymnoascus verrucosus]